MTSTHATKTSLADSTDHTIPSATLENTVEKKTGAATKTSRLNEVDEIDEVDKNCLSECEIAIKTLTTSDQLPQPWQAPILSATFKNIASDFQVDEVMDIELSTEGEHLWLLIEKTGMNTIYVAQQLAKWANISNRDVGYSGLKDRQAVTTQWFSLRIPKRQLPDMPFEDFIKAQSHNKSQQGDISKGQNSKNKNAENTKVGTKESLQVLTQNWHNKKLNKGTHKSNRFRITLHNIQLNPQVASTHSMVDDVLKTIKCQGVPNYFGSQRFGISGNNVIQALEWFEQGTINGRKPHPKRSRDIQSLLLSSARSAIFNQILSERVKNNSWNTGLDGEIFNLDGSGSVFASEKLDEELRQRLASGDIHPTAPLWGIKNDKVTGKVKQLEYEVVNNNPVLKKLALGLEDKQIKTMRRPLRLFVSEFDWQWTDEQTLVLKFSLPTGTFATSVLASFVDNLNS